MKGINLKRIGAIVAGATILASSVAFAGPLYYGDTMLVTENGQPLAKVAVGAGAAASDGAGAANVAAYLAHEAYKSDTYTAKAGDVSCEASGESTCTISDKKVTLDVTVPGATSTGSYTVNTLVGDYIDRTLLDRGVSSTKTYALSIAETSDVANPFTNGDSTPVSLDSAFPSPISIYRITGSNFEPMADYTVEDDDASSSYKEVQNFWIGSESNGGDITYKDSADNLALNMKLAVYSLKFFDSNDFGIPVCTQATNASLYYTCDDTYKTDTHKVSIMFLGEKWIISEMSPPTTSTTSTQKVVGTAGSYIKLAKESVQDVLNKGEYLEVEDLQFVLDDVSLATGSTNLHPAIISIYAAGTEEALKSTQINPGTTQDVSVPGYGTYKVHVYKTAPGYTFGATWADMAVFSNEVKLESGSDFDPDVDANNHWKVTLGWKNKGATSTDTRPDHLRSILIYVPDEMDDLVGTDSWTPGLSIPVVQDPTAWQFTFSGLDIDDSDRGSLTFSMERQSDKSIAINSTHNCNISAPYIKISVPEEHKMTLQSASLPATAPTGTGGQGYHYEAYVAANITPGILCPTANYNMGSVAMKTSTSSNAYYVIKNNSAGTGYVDIKWDYAGTAGSWGSGGDIRVSYNGTNASLLAPSYTDSKLGMALGVSEEVGEGESANKAAKYLFGVNYSGTDGASSTFNFDGSTATTYFYKDHVYAVRYGPAYSTNGTIEEGTITERGSKFLSIDDTSVKFKIADKVAHAQLKLATTEAEETSENTVRLTDMEEGESRDVSGTDVSVKVVEIKATGTCDSAEGGAPMCTVSGESTAYLENAAGEDVGDTLDAVTMYDADAVKDLVVLDSEVSAGTLISIGGPNANTKTAEAQAEGDFALDGEGDTVVTQVGNTIVVAGYTAEDTLDAVDEFLDSLTTE